MKKIALDELEEMYRNRYVSLSDLEEFKSKHDLVAPEKNEVRKRYIQLTLTLRIRKLKEYRRTVGRAHRLLNCRAKMNREFIKREQAKDYRIEGNKLDPQQIEAVVACEDAELILAPAGSGKTASLLAKLNYLTDQLGILPEDILVIAFTNKVVAELKDRIKQTGIEIRTFHSLGNKIIKAELKEHKLISELEASQFFRQEVWKFDWKNEEEAEGFEKLVTTVLGLQKSERVTFKELRRQIEEIGDEDEKVKALEFYERYEKVAKAYVRYLEKNQLYDFADMLNYATELAEKKSVGSFGYRYILVDEAQDMSTAKFLLLKAVLEKCEKVKLFAVGDDWQSIYRFAGSNLKVLDDFEKIFGRETYRGMIELTYRFGQPTARISNRFIQKNPHQSRKKVMPHVKRRTPIVVRLNDRAKGRVKNSAPPDYKTIDQELRKLHQEYGEELFKKKVQIISRYNNDIYRVVPETGGKYQNAKLMGEAKIVWRLGGRELEIPFCSMHKAKGITRDIVLVINANDSEHGMPATRKSDPVAEILMAELDAYPYAEERRLFYVAITRAKERTIIIADAGSVSPFVLEICPELQEMLEE